MWADRSARMVRVNNRTNLFLEAASKIDEIEGRHGRDPDLRRVVAGVYGMVSLQYQSAQKEVTQARPLVSEILR